jgi:hypothetical protein
VNAAVTVHYYDGLYHEIFNEPEQESVIGDTVAWLNSVMGVGTSCGDRRSRAPTTTSASSPCSWPSRRGA